MNDLIAAAKAVIDCYDRHLTIQTSLKVKKLRAAVERAEQAPDDFCEWWHSNEFGNYGVHHAQMSWVAAQQAERERCREIVNSELDVNGRDDDWYIVCNAILEKIDE